MVSSRPILFVEDDVEEQEIISDLFKSFKISSPLVFKSNAEEAVEYLNNTNQLPRLIISDINMVGMSGLEFKSYINNEPRLNNLMIPFIFYSGVAINFSVALAYKLNIQGFFVKESGIENTRINLQRIIEYWHYCIIPE